MLVEFATLHFTGIRPGSVGNGVRKAACRCNGYGKMPLLGCRTRPGMQSMHVCGGGKGAGSPLTAAPASPRGPATVPGAALTAASVERSPTRAVPGADPAGTKSLQTTGVPWDAATVTTTAARAITAVTTATAEAITASATPAMVPTTANVTPARAPTAVTTAGDPTRVQATCRQIQCCLVG